MVQDLVVLEEAAAAVVVVGVCGRRRRRHHHLPLQEQAGVRHRSELAAVVDQEVATTLRPLACRLPSWVPSPLWRCCCWSLTRPSALRRGRPCSTLSSPATTTPRLAVAAVVAATVAATATAVMAVAAARWLSCPWQASMGETILRLGRRGATAAAEFRRLDPPTPRLGLELAPPTHRHRRLRQTLAAEVAVAAAVAVQVVVVVAVAAMVEETPPPVRPVQTTGARTSTSCSEGLGSQTAQQQKASLRSNRRRRCGGKKALGLGLEPMAALAATAAVAVVGVLDQTATTTGLAVVETTAAVATAAATRAVASS